MPYDLKKKKKFKNLRHALGHIVATIDLTRAKFEHFGLTRAARYMAFDVHQDEIDFFGVGPLRDRASRP